ncbi:MarR family winged helix-turn-helix transcriptional regulator [Paracoccus siganidrum]|uniref:MarR family transcriptional regulator n=1 Tax=Paracoccus siganidrum TaxID=1276757 RepID=A0A418ZYS7_9RHOB|nr:MarR family winged helix-turn-helix transcriptional regulator [Paracoccus siganidrum]RJL05657.1 MarR family transcriptional regulator [Paracoccus siganidrum]RMC29786.1 MarR family transcriptional regulator [Paracoccus siganidrum]
MPHRFPEFDLQRFLAYRLARAAQHLSEELARRYRDRFGISIPEWRVLAHLAYSGDVSVRDIEIRTGMEKSQVSRAAARLEAAGHVAKQVNECDRRLVSLSLTPGGCDLMAELLPVALAYQAEIEQRLGGALAGFEAGLDRLIGAAEDPADDRGDNRVERREERHDPAA